MVVAMGFRHFVALALGLVVFSSTPLSMGAPTGKLGAPHAVADSAVVPAEATKLIEEAIAKGKAQKFPEAVDLLTQALGIIEKKLGKDHYLLGNTLNLLAQIETIQGHLDAAEKYAERSIAVLKKDVNADPLRLGHALIRRAEVHRERGERDQEIELRKLTITLFSKAFGFDGVDAMAETLALARAYTRWGMYAEARPVYERWINTIEKKFGAGEPVLVDILMDLAINEMHAGNYADAQKLLERALEIYKKIGRTQDQDTAVILNNMAEVHYQRGEYAKAEELYARVLAVYENNRNVHPQSLGIVLGNLGSVRLDLGRTYDALKLLRKSLEIQETHLGSTNAALVTPLTNLGEALLRTGELSESIPYLERALVLREKALGATHPRLVTPLINLGSARLDEGKISEAETMFMRGLAIQEKTVGADHPLNFQIHQALGILEQKRQKLAKAEEHHARALEVVEKSFGLTHPDVVAPLKSLAVLLTYKKDYAGARKLIERAGNVAEKHTQLLLVVGSEAQKISWLQTIAPVWSLTLEHHLRREPTNPDVARLALEATWRQKGRALDAVASGMRLLRRDASPEEKALLAELRDKETQFANMMVSGVPLDDHRIEWIKKLQALGRDADRLLEKINARSMERWMEPAPVTVAKLQAMLPKDAAYVEIVRHALGWALLPGEGAKWQYTAYVVSSEGDPQAVEIGTAKDVEEAVAQWREALADPDRSDVKRLSRAFSEKFMQSLKAKLGSSRQLIVAPDAALNFIPFEALTDDKGHYWVENLSISYVTSGREVFRWPTRVQSQTAPVVLANPDFGTFDSQANKGSGARGYDDTGISRLGFGPIPGTADEGKAVAKQLNGAVLHMDKNATKNELMSVSGPKMLHLATHGFFMGEFFEHGKKNTRGFTIEGDPPVPEVRAVPTVTSADTSPMLRSGVALAQANVRGQTRGEGILTALEASSLDLSGTKLVVLSACETALGGVTQSEGVQGLRRAFVLAGAETTVMSLWKVDDSATRDLMVGYYQRLESGGGRSEALRQTRLGMLANPARSHPFFWASFIVSGDPSRLDGTMPTVAPVAPGPRGCACVIAGERDAHGVSNPAFVFVVAGMIAAWRRRRLS